MSGEGGRVPMMQTVARYVMNPAEDMILFGDELTEGMWALAEDWVMRQPHGDGEDDKIRRQRFRRVTRLARTGDIVRFVGEWVDGYQEVHSYSIGYGWLVKKEPPDPASAKRPELES